MLLLLSAVLGTFTQTETRLGRGWWEDALLLLLLLLACAIENKSSSSMLHDAAGFAKKFAKKSQL